MSSSYIASFENQQFHTYWNGIKEKAEKVNIESAPIQFLEDFARFVKVFNFIDNLFENIDPELIPKNLLDNLRNRASTCLTQISSALTSSSQSNLNSANTQLDEILISLKPYSLYDNKLKRSLRAAIRAYIAEIDSHLENIPNTQEEYNKAVELREKIESYHDEIFVGDEESNAIIEKISSALQNIEEKFEVIDDYHTKLLMDDEDESLKTQIENARKSIDENVDEAKNLLTETSSKIDDLNKFYVRIFGSLNDEGIREGGLKQELETRIEQLDTYRKNQEKKFIDMIQSRKTSLDTYEKEQKERYEKLFEQIESLLPGATSAGLAKAYQDRKKEYSMPIIGWSVVFIIAMVSMFFAGYLNMENLATWEDTLRHLLHYAPLYVPAVWLAIYASRRRSESRALEEEYAHKEALAKSYSSYKQQVEKIGGEDPSLITKLLDKTIDTVSDNPSKVLDRKHGDNSPAIDLAEKVANKIISKMPKIIKSQEKG